MQRPALPSKVDASLSRKRMRPIQRSISGVETLLNLQRTHGNAFVQRLIQRKLSVSQPSDKYEQEADRMAEAVVQPRRAETKPAISSVAEQENEMTQVVQQSGTGRQDTVTGYSGDRLRIQRYKLRGFPRTKASRMRSAIASAITSVANCKKLWAYGKLAIIHSLKQLRYDYVPNLGICGWTFPGSWYVEVGKKAFDVSTCCHLSSTLAHEAAHTELYTEGRARKMECKCFGCSC